MTLANALKGKDNNSYYFWREAKSISLKGRRLAFLLEDGSVYVVLPLIRQAYKTRFEVDGLGRTFDYFLGRYVKEEHLTED